MKNIFVTSVILILAGGAYGQAQVPEATELYVDLEEITPGEGNEPPSDAVVLFDGSDLDEWQKPHEGFGRGSMQGLKDVIPGISYETSRGVANWKIENNEMVVAPGEGGIATRKMFGDIQLHIEWNSPVDEGKTGQGYSNSGVFLMGLYEVQILNSYENETYQNGQAGSVYKQHIPLVNASKPPGTWQEYDIIFTAPRFSEKGTLLSPARLTVFHNGVLIQNNVTLSGPTCYIGSPYYIAHRPKLPLILQDHSDPVRFRNIWVREL